MTSFITHDLVAISNWGMGYNISLFLTFFGLSMRTSRSKVAQQAFLGLLFETSHYTVASSFFPTWVQPPYPILVGVFIEGLGCSR